MSSYNHFGCSWCGGLFNGRNYPGCSSEGSGNKFVYDPNPYSYNETPDFFNQPPQHQYETYSCELCGDSPHHGFDFQTRTLLVYEQDPCNNQNYSNDQSPYHSTSLPHQFCYCEIRGGPHYSSDCETRNPLVYKPNPYPSIDLYDLKGSDDGDNEINSLTKEPFDTLLMGDEVISTTLERENDKFIKSSVDDLVPIPRESEVTSVCDDLECDMHVNTPLPTTDVREEDFDINLHLGEYVFDFLMENVDVADLPRHLVKQLFSHLVKNPSLTKRISDEPLGDDSKPRSYDVTFLNPLFDFNDDFTLCNDNPLFDEEFEDISSLDSHELTPVIDESTLLVTLPLPCIDVLGDAIIDIDLLLREHLNTLSMGDREIDFNPSRGIEELERLLADDPVSVPRVFDGPLGNYDSMSRSSETSDLFEELIAEFDLDDLIPTKIDDRYHDSKESSSVNLPLPDFKQFSLREVERFDPFFSLTQSGGKTRVMETSSFGFHHMPSPRPAAYSPTEVIILYDRKDLRACFQSSNHPVSDLLLILKSSILIIFDPFVEIPSDESKVHIEVLSVLWGNRLPIPDGSLPLSSLQKGRGNYRGRNKTTVFGQFAPDVAVV
ncbi:hypothetical protein Tco_0327677 [Tanacetum coccineum]